MYMYDTFVCVCLHNKTRELDSARTKTTALSSLVALPLRLRVYTTLPPPPLPPRYLPLTHRARARRGWWVS